MQTTPQISFLHMDSSAAVEAQIRSRLEQLDRLFDRIISCRVVVECAHPRHHQGNLFQVRIDLNLPGHEIVVGRDPAAHHAHEDVYVAIRDTFDAARRLLEDHIRKDRGDVKLRAVPDHGRIQRLLPDYGFILSADGSEIYFHRNSVVGGGFDKLEIGDEVRFVAQFSESAQGAQASTVMPIGKHHLSPDDTVRA